MHSTTLGAVLPHQIGPVPQSALVPTRFFTPAQTEGSFQSAPYALAETHTELSTASQKKPGMAHSALCAPVFTVSLLPEMDAQYAAIGNERRAVSILLTTSATSVLDVPPPLTVLKAALEHRKLKASTPYKPDAWQLQLLQAGLFERYSHIPDGLRFGFRLDFPVITSTQSPPNKESLIEYT
jgi:hypothetical protein